MAGVKLYPHQETALRKMHNGCILCGEVGSGKSITGLAYYYISMGGEINGTDFVKMKKPKDLLIITTAKKRDSKEWEFEMAPFLLSTHKDACAYDISVVVDSWNCIKKYNDVENTFIIFDEDKVTGSGAWVKAFLKMTKGAGNQWIILSATPGDTYMDYAPVFIANGYFRNFKEFRDKHVRYNPYVQFPQVKDYLYTERLDRLRRNVLVEMPFDRHTIPHHEYIYTDYDTFKYKDIIKSRWDPFKDEPIDNASQFCYCLRKVVNLSDARQIAFLEVLEKHPKVIVFYNFNDEVDLLIELCKAAGRTYIEWNGRKHQEIPREESNWVMFVQYNSGSEGWNCTLTDTIIFYSQNYSYKIMTQAAGRIDRANTPFTDLYYYHFLSRSGIDLAIKKALDKKKKFNESIYFGKF